MNSYQTILEERKRKQFGLPRIQVKSMDEFDGVYTTKPETNETVWAFTLSNLFPDGETFQVRHINNGIQTSNMARFEHGVTYYTTDYVLHDYLEREGRLDAITSENKAFYDNLNVKHTEEKQTCCGGRRMRLKVFYFNIKEV